MNLFDTFDSRPSFHNLDAKGAAIRIMADELESFIEWLDNLEGDIGTDRLVDSMPNNSLPRSVGRTRLNALRNIAHDLDGRGKRT